MNAATLTARRPAVAGVFYPLDAKELRTAVETYLQQAPATEQAGCPKVLIAPHAGYIYSGATAGHAYALLKPWAAQIKRVVLLGPCHRVAVHGLALPDYRQIDAFYTPLGAVILDKAALAQLSKLPQVVCSDQAHAQEHALEVHLPFLQSVLQEFVLIPLAVGDADAQQVAQVLAQVWGGPETLIVISTDLSHYHPYQQAQAIDRATLQELLNLQALHSGEQACGMRPLNGLTLLAQQRGMKIALLQAVNSGDTAGDKQRVVGYAALALYEAPQTQAGAQHIGALLLQIARHALQRHFEPQLAALELSVNQALMRQLQMPAATFVTLSQNGQLRGCIGSLEAYRPLLEDLQENALSAALRDPRFPPLQAQELAVTRIEISVLSPASPIYFKSEAEALAQLRPQIDGVILQSGSRRSTFLPQVWEQLPDVSDFMAHLKHKAGLPPHSWPADLRLWRYQVQKYKEGAHEPA
ncbi:AmmeMemoRadiSam system protein B [Massilia sp. W12]|uniref:AmmeMemoRadiSam system protein B n=1 Tax=Massilia sp. W12 TaxID=3126507 RepID=UPI0030D24889